MNQKPESIDSTTAIRARMASLSPEQQKPGTLTTWADGEDNKYYEFIGNGTITGAELLDTVVAREGQADSASGLKPFEKNPEFNKYAAEQLLGRGEATYDAHAPIAKGKVEEEIALKDLLKLATPFLQKYAEAVRAHDGLTPAGHGGSDEDHRKLTGQLHSVGLTLPID